MHDLLNKPPISAPPDLPPFLTKKKGPERRRIIIIPDLRFMEGTYQKVYDHENNWITIIYAYMNRVIGEGIFDPSAHWEFANVHTRRYRMWLETYEMKNGIPPHISFGGAIESGQGDPTFLSRWQDYARETFF